MEIQEESFIDQLSEEIQEDNFEAAKILINKIVVNSSFYKLLFHSLDLERKQIFHHFLQKSNIDINVQNETGKSLLHQSLNCSDQYFLNEILQIRVPLDSHMYRTILHYAVAANKPNFVEALLKCGAPMNNENIMGMTPLDIAIGNSNLEIVSMFLYYNCDTSSRSGVISPFMYSMICRSDLEIQLLLLQYETDINNSDLLMNNLFIAIEKCPYLISHILSFGADVNQICHDKNIIEFVLKHPIEPNIFRMIWNLFDYKTWECTKNEYEINILLAIIYDASLPNCTWNEYIRIVIESSKIQDILNYQTHFLLSVFVEEYINRGFVESDFYDLICILLQNGCIVHSINVHTVYNLLGNSSKILKLLLHMDIEKANLLNVDMNFIRVRYTFEAPVRHLLRNFLINMKAFDMTLSYKDILRFFTVPLKVKHYLQNYESVPCPIQVIFDSAVPSLIELSRNKSRDFICNKYNVKTASHYLSIVNHFQLPKIVKDILTFERPLYSL